MEAKVLNLLLGLTGSQRIDFLRQAAVFGAEVVGQVGVVWPEGETDPADGEPFPGKIPLTYWKIEDGNFKMRWPLESGAGGTVFLVASGEESPIDLIEVLPKLLNSLGARLGQIITLVNCRRLQDESRLESWYKACIHFSDIVLLGNRDGVEEKWMREYQKGFVRNSMPCHLDLVLKDGRTKQPMLLFSEEARRISLYFDDLEPDPEDPEMPEPPQDVYFEREPSGERRVRLPVIFKRTRGEGVD